MPNLREPKSIKFCIEFLKYLFNNYCINNELENIINFSHFVFFTLIINDLTNISPFNRNQ